MNPQELDKQIANLYRQLAELHEQRATASAPTAAQSAPAWAAFLSVSADTVRRRAADGKPLMGYRVERVSERLFRLVPLTAPSKALVEREGERRKRLIQQLL